jgi:hypothetical protein
VVQEPSPSQTVWDNSNTLATESVLRDSPEIHHFGSPVPQSTSTLSIHSEASVSSFTQDQRIPYRPRVPTRKLTGSSLYSIPPSPPPLPPRRSTAENSGNLVFPQPEPFQHVPPQPNPRLPERMLPSDDLEAETPTQRRMPGGLDPISRTYSQQQKVLDESDLSPAEKRRILFASRIEAARDIIPNHIILRIFKDPSECVESFSILDAMKKG